MAFEPSFVTCTYGAGGTTRDKTLDIVTEVRRRYGCAGRLASDLRRLDGRRSARLSDGGHRARRREHRRPARRSAARRNVVSSRSPAAFATPTNWSRSSAANFRSSASPWPAIPRRIRKPPAPKSILENLKRKVDRRRRCRHHAVVLRQRRFLPLSRSLPGTRAFPCRSCPASCRLPISRKFSGSRRCARRSLPDELVARTCRRRRRRSPHNSKSASSTPPARCRN